MKPTTTTVAAVAALSAPALASLSGHAVDATWFFPDFNTPFSTAQFVVSDAVEMPSPTSQSFDLSADAILVTFHSATTWLEADFNGWHFADASGAIDEIAGFQLEAVTGSYTAADQIVTGFNADAVWIDFGGFSPQAGATVLFRITFVPAPGAAAPLALGALLASRRRR